MRQNLVRGRLADDQKRRNRRRQGHERGYRRRWEIHRQRKRE